jgi:Cys-rich repeat protein
MNKSLVLLVVLLGGCGLYWGGDDGDDVICNKAYEAVPAEGFVDPSTGQCQYYGGGYPCDGTCGPCAETTGQGYAAPDWASCYSPCSYLDQNSCEATAGCHADFYDNGSFWQCVGTPPTGAIEGGSCQGLDAQTCSEHDDCVSNYAYDPSGNTRYETCAPENQQYCLADSDCGSGQRCDTSVCNQPNCPPDADCGSVCEGVCVPDAACSNVDCGMGYHCEETCYPCDTTDGSMCDPYCSPSCVPDQTCASVDCGPGYECAMECSSGTCYPACIPVNGGGPGDCNGTVTCNSAPPTCPANTTPGVANGCYTGYCIPLNQCGPNDPGQCYAPLACASAPPSCPMGTLPGIVNGCWSGYCIPTGSCEVPACETLTTESACTSRSDCMPVYAGSDCTCTPSGCTCTTLSYERCESVLMPL